MTPHHDQRRAGLERLAKTLTRVVNQRLDEDLAADREAIGTIHTPFAMLSTTTTTNGVAQPRRAASTSASNEAILEALEALVADPVPGRGNPTNASAPGYQPRLVASDLTDVDLLGRARQHATHVLLEGNPGVGKTELVRATFAGELEHVDGHGDLEVAELVGSYVPRPGGEFEWREGPLLRAMRHGRVLFVDDISRIPASVLARLYPAMDARAQITVNEGPDCETVVAETGFIVVGAHNPGVAGAMIDAPLRSRFAISLEVVTDLDVALQLGVPMALIRVASVLHAMRDAGEISWAPEMRELLHFAAMEPWATSSVAAGNLLSRAPEEDRDEIADQLRLAYPGVEPLRTGQA